jgi:hypothetical protein
MVSPSCPLVSPSWLLSLLINYEPLKGFSCVTILSKVITTLHVIVIFPSQKIELKPSKPDEEQLTRETNSLFWGKPKTRNNT